ncbi:glycosyltransferase [Thermocoleostomius sinensis]|nr:glycosyltransferase [Thermocoleostomius sinensis]
MVCPSSSSRYYGFVPKVSVIVPIYNGETDVPELIACLGCQTYPTAQVEYIVVDNGSHDRTRQLLETAVSSTSLPLRLVNETSIQSSYAARNAGICTASGDVYAFTDADCRPDPDWLLHLVQPFVEAEVGLVAGEIIALPGTTFLERYADRHETLSQKHTLTHSFRPYGQTANLAVRRTVFEQTGLFRPYLTTGGDADLCWRVLQSGQWRIQFAEQSVVRHRHRSTLGALYSQWRRYGCSNRYLSELHGVSLMREMSVPDYLYRCGRWLFKEIPAACLSATGLPSRATSIESVFDRLIDTPLDLLCRHARAQGQRQSKLPEVARQVAYLPTVPSSDASSG